jgi:cyclopropane fatty-acyl-phospholipid synthase-like methyltransferase
MDQLQHDDVPYGNDWDSAAEAAAYAEESDLVRPWRVDVRDHIARQVSALPPGTRVLELGSGPGLLARRVLETCPNVAAYTLLDFSEPMLAASRERVASFPAASFVRASFKTDDWPRLAGGPFDCILSMQAVHELRHKQHARRLYEQVHGALAVPGRFLIGDHTPFDASPRSTTLYMTEAEQLATLTAAGFADVRVDLRRGSLVLCEGVRR